MGAAATYSVRQGRLYLGFGNRPGTMEFQRE
jgi:hypothetical protein